MTAGLYSKGVTGAEEVMEVPESLGAGTEEMVAMVGTQATKSSATLMEWREVARRAALF